MELDEHRETEGSPPEGEVTSTLPAEVLGELCGPRLFVLATASLDGVPTTTLVSWMCAVGPSRLAIALDHRGLAYRNAIENPVAALEVTLPAFSATLRGTLSLARDQLASAPFCCAGFHFDVVEIRDHGVPASVVRPATYEYVEAKRQYAVREAEIVAELRSLPEQSLAAARGG